MGTTTVGQKENPCGTVLKVNDNTCGVAPKLQAFTFPLSERFEFPREQLNPRLLLHVANRHTPRTHWLLQKTLLWLKDVKNVLAADRKYEVPSRQIHADIIALQCWIQCSVEVGSVITTSVSNKYCTYIEFYSAGTPFPHRQAQTTEDLPVVSDDNHKKDWRKHRKHKWNWALTHPQLSPVTASLQVASDSSFRLSCLLFFLHFLFRKTNTVKGNLNTVRPQFVSAEPVALWRNK